MSNDKKLTYQQNTIEQWVGRASPDRVTVSALRLREYDMKGVASLVSAPNAGTGFELPFVVQGPWDDPLIFPDPEPDPPLAGRSSAARRGKGSQDP